jgi:hypothetical protein
MDKNYSDMIAVAGLSPRHVDARRVGPTENPNDSLCITAITKGFCDEYKTPPSGISCSISVLEGKVKVMSFDYVRNIENELPIPSNGVIKINAGVYFKIVLVSDMAVILNHIEGIGAATCNLFGLKY